MKKDSLYKANFPVSSQPAVNELVRVALLVTVLVLVVAAPGIGQSEIYKWTDSDGNVHFGDRPVNMDEATEMQVDTSKGGISHSSGNEQAREDLLKRIDADNKIDAENQKKQAKKDKKRRKKCKHYKKELNLHERSTHTYTKSKDGELNFYSNAQHDALRAKLKSRVNKYCR